jgi:hypothetical protein
MNKGYKKEFIVKITLSPGNGYEDSSTPQLSVMRNGIRRAVEEGLSPSGYIAAKVTAVKTVPIPLTTVLKQRNKKRMERASRKTQ